MAKPILVAEIPCGDTIEESKKRFKVARGALIESVKDDYHVIVVGKSDINNANVYVLNADKIDPIEIENLKQLVEEKWLRISL